MLPKRSLIQNFSMFFILRDTHLSNESILKFVSIHIKVFALLETLSFDLKNFCWEIKGKMSAVDVMLLKFLCYLHSKGRRFSFTCSHLSQ